MKSDYPAFLQAYDELIKFYWLNDLGKLGITYKSLFDFTIEQNEVGFLSFMVRYYLKQLDYDRSWEVMKKLRDLDAEGVEIEQYKEVLGNDLAQRDYRKNKEANLVQQINTYCPGGKWCRPFRDAYAKTWMKSSDKKFKNMFLFLKVKISGWF